MRIYALRMLRADRKKKKDTSGSWLLNALCEKLNYFYATLGIL